MNQTKPANLNNDPLGREQMNVVVIGHVDHGKSTVIGRLLADTGALPQGKLEMVKENCRRNARPFEYAFLLDALKDEQAQGITIDSARCFFKSDKREYIIIDAPGHIEFLKNMISGAARAEAALLVIDANEGVQENSRRHGYLLSMLGIRQIAVGVNKMDLVDYRESVFNTIREEYLEFLSHVSIDPAGFIPMSAREGDNIQFASPQMSWYDGPSVLGMFDSFTKEPSREDKPLRFPIQDIYKFTANQDDRRIVAGRIETGKVNVDDDVIFLPSGKTSKISGIEGLNTHSTKSVAAGESTGFTLDTQIYIHPGELMCKVGEDQARVSSQLKVNVFWLGRQPFIKNKRYKMKLAGVRIPVWLREVTSVMDASNLKTDSNRQQVERHDVAECTLETLKPIACDLSHEIAQTGRFVIIDNYEIAGGGVILDTIESEQNRITEHVQQREQSWDRTSITAAMRADRLNQKSAMILICGPVGAGKAPLAKALEKYLFENDRFVYYLGVSNSLIGMEAQLGQLGERDEFLRRLGEVAHLFTDAGVILIATVSDLDDYELEMVETLNKPNDCLVVNVGENNFNGRTVDLQVGEDADIDEAIETIRQLLMAKQYFVDYSI
jgi:bifunctional enzyme CysN/CysC